MVVNRSWSTPWWSIWVDRPEWADLSESTLWCLILTDWKVFGVQRVFLAECIVVRSATKPHEGQALLDGRFRQFGNVNMSYFS